MQPVSSFAIGCISFLSIMTGEMLTYWLMGFPFVGAVIVAAMVSIWAAVAYARAVSEIGARVATARAVVITALPFVAFLVWAGLVFWGVRAVEAKMAFARIPAGCFAMGNPEKRGNVYFEGPVHNVCIKEFELGRYEVTQEEWGRVMIFPNDPRPSPSMKSLFTGLEITGDRLPVGSITWSDAQNFIQLMSFFGHGHYRLPTEAEWEYAARAGTTTAFYWGTQATDACTYENIFDLAAIGHRPVGVPPPPGLVQCDDGHLGPAPVGSFKPNPWGLYDMLGNVQELVDDCWVNGYDRAPSDGSAMQARPCTYRVLRGGSWSTGDTGPISFRVTARTNALPDRSPLNASPQRGVRLARAVAE